MELIGCKALRVLKLNNNQFTGERVGNVRRPIHSRINVYYAVYDFPADKV